MLAKLKSIVDRDSIGVFATDERICVVHARSTLWHSGVVQKWTINVRNTEGEAQLKNLARRLSHIPATIGIPNSSTYFVTLKNGHPVKEPMNLFSRNVDSPTAFVSSLGTDHFCSNVKGGCLYHFAASRKQSISRALRAWPNNGQQRRVEPSTLAVVRYVTSQGRFGYFKRELHLRYFKRAKEGILVLLFGKSPLYWESIQIEDDTRELSVLEPSINRLQVYCTQRLELGRIKKMVVYDAIDLDGFSSRLGMAVQSEHRHRLTDEKIAFFLATSDRRPFFRRFNLARKFQKRPPWHVHFPKFRAASLVFMLTLATFFYVKKVSLAQENLAAIEMQTKHLSRGGHLEIFDLRQKRQDTFARTEKLSNFIGGRLGWLDILETIPTLLPNNTWVTNIEAVNDPFHNDSIDRHPRVSLDVRLGAIVGKRVTAPREITDTVEAIKGSSVFTDKFSVIQLLTVQWHKELGKDIAYFTIRCTTDGGGQDVAE